MVCQVVFVRSASSKHLPGSRICKTDWRFCLDLSNFPTKVAVVNILKFRQDNRSFVPSSLIAAAVQVE